MARKLLTPPSDKWSALPAHEYEDGRCMYCNDEVVLESYDQYTKRWYRTEYEGAESHRPMRFLDWAYLRATCLFPLDSV
jgi:hypothetical protein